VPGTFTRIVIYRILGCIGLAFLLTLVYLTPFGQRFERNFGLSTLYYLRGPVEVPEEAIVIGLDRTSVEWIEFHSVDLASASETLYGCLTPHARNRLPDIRDVVDLPRGLHGCLLRELSRRDARVITFDILFRRPQPEDEVFAREIADSGRVVLFERIRTIGEAGPGGEAALQRFSPRDLFTIVALDTAAFLLNAPLISYVESYVRRLPEFPDLGVMPEVVWQHYTGNAAPLAAPGNQPIWLYGPPKSIKTYTLRDVFDRDTKNPLPQSLASVAVFIGLSDPAHPGTMDHYKIPILGAETNDIGGVELAATAFLNLVHGEEIWRPGLVGEAALVFLIGLAAALSARVLPGRRGLIAIAGLTVAYGGLAWAAFASQQVWLPFGVPIYLGLIATVLLGLATRYAFAKQLVARLTPQPVASILLEGMEAERRAARTEQATVMFTDLVGSTNLGDQLTNVEYTEVMNRYYDTATTTIEAHNGMVIEYMGDDILAVFSESVADPSHAT